VAATWPLRLPDVRTALSGFPGYAGCRIQGNPFDGRAAAGREGVEGGMAESRVRRESKRIFGQAAPGIESKRPMTDTVESLILDLLDWLSGKDRSYEETMEAWRTSCPKLPVWEDANERGLVCVEYNQSQSSVRVTVAGVKLLHDLRPESSLRLAAR
jgi:hypothetical protein